MLGVVGGGFDLMRFKQSRYDNVLLGGWLEYVQSVHNMPKTDVPLKSLCIT